MSRKIKDYASGVKNTAKNSANSLKSAMLTAADNHGVSDQIQKIGKKEMAFFALVFATCLTLEQQTGQSILSGPPQLLASIISAIATLLSHPAAVYTAAAATSTWFFMQNNQLNAQKPEAQQNQQAIQDVNPQTETQPQL